MNTNDVIGIMLVALVLVSACIGLSQLTKPRHLTEEEYERRVKESSGLAGGVMNALGKALHPNATKAAEVQQDMREGYYKDVEVAEDNSDPEESTEDPTPTDRIS